MIEEPILRNIVLWVEAWNRSYGKRRDLLETTRQLIQTPVENGWVKPH